MGNQQDASLKVPQVGPKDLALLLAKTIPARIPLLITGMPGIGKTDIMKQGIRAIEPMDEMILHPVISDPTDFKGMPWVLNRDGSYAADFIPFGDLEKIIKTTRPLTVVFDDLGQAPPTVQAAIMQLLLARRINEHKVSDLVTFIAASNRKKDMAAVTGMLEPVKSRFCSIVELTVDPDAWHEWAIQNGIDHRLRAFLRWKKELLCDFKPRSDFIQSPVPRTVHNLDKLIKLDLPESVKFGAYSGAVGTGFVKEMLSFFLIYNSMKDLKLVPTHPDAVDVPSKPDVRHAVISAIQGMCDRKTMKNVMKYVARFPIEYQALFVSDIEIGQPDLCETSAMIDWKIQNGDLHV
jgi:hypothetical protein